jgi:para-nitrobenzyl esterase
MKSNRRKFIQNLGTGAAGLALGTTAVSISSCSKVSDKKEIEDDQILFIGDNIALAETQYGKVRGYILRGINYFLGIPYGADTSGSNRFMPPQKPKPWTDVFPAVWWGNSAPQNMEEKYSRDRYASFRDHWNFDDVSEDCLRINVFTPAINDGKKRPVLVWLHGGGFVAGNGIEHDGYNGENLARFGDCVFCSLNHRLGPLGFANLAGVGGEKYASSGNVGMLDIVAALEWVRDNIANFGGDPGNVTIIGQSGGGMKVIAICAMPSAKGLFHKGVVLSGAITKFMDNDYSEKIGSGILKEAGLPVSQIDKLQEMPWKDYMAIAARAIEKVAKEEGAKGLFDRMYGPMADGSVIPQHPYLNEPTPLAANIPLIICSTEEELPPDATDPKLENITFEEVIGKLKTNAGFGSGYGDKAKEVVEAYAKAFPEKKPVQIWALLGWTRQSLVDLADSKSKQEAPVFVALFGWQPPLFDYRIRAFHCLDICFWFYNTDLMITHSGGGARPRNLSAKMAGALVQFMKTGDPNGGGLPAWPKYTSINGEVMVLNDVCEVKNDPDREARKSLPA